MPVDLGTPSTFGDFDFDLSETDETRARELHASSIVVDMMYYGPCGYRCFTPEMTAKLQAEWHRARDGWAAFNSAYLMPIRLTLTGDSDELEEHWRGTGITGGNREITLDYIEVPVRETMRTIAATIAHFDRSPWVTKALEAADFDRAKSEDKFAGFMNAQMSAGLSRLEHLELAHDLGVRMLMLTYNKQNLVGAGCLEVNDAGLSSLGIRLVKRMNELGIIVDTAHCGRHTTLDACAQSARPVVASHVGAAGFFNHPRNKSDEQLRAIADTGGVVGVVALPSFLSSDESPTIDDMINHIEYVASVVGWQHVGVGTDHPAMSDKWTLQETAAALHEHLGFGPRDFGDMTLNLVGFDDHRDSVNIARGLVKRGFTDDQIRGILGGNFVRVFKDVCG